MKYSTTGLSGLNVHGTKLEQSGCWDSSEVWPQEAQPVCAARRDFLNLCCTGGGMVRSSRSALSCVCVPRPSPSQLLLTLLVFWLHWSSERVCFCLGRAASVLRDQSWLFPSLHEWIWCQGQGKAVAAAPEHHLPAGESVTGPRWGSCLSLWESPEHRKLKHAPSGPKLSAYQRAVLTQSIS